MKDIEAMVTINTVLLIIILTTICTLSLMHKCAT